MAFFFLTLRRLSVSLRSAVLLTCCVAFGTLLFPYSGYFFSDPFTSSILKAAVFVVSDSTRPLSVRGAVIVGLLLASVVWIRPTMILATGVFVAGLLLRDGKIAMRRAAMMSAIPAISGLLYLLSNKIVFGSGFGKRVNTSGRVDGDDNDHEVKQTHHESVIHRGQSSRGLSRSNCN